MAYKFKMKIGSAEIGKSKFSLKTDDLRYLFARVLEETKPAGFFAFEFIADLLGDLDLQEYAEYSDTAVWQQALELEELANKFNNSYAQHHQKVEGV